jgi:predicted ATPase
MRAILSWALFCRGEVAAAEATCTRALDEARRLGQGYSLAFALNNHCYIATIVHPPQAALPAVEEMLAVAEAHGLGYFVALATVMRGWCLGMAGDLPGGLAVLHAGLAAYRATGSRLSLAAVLRLAAELEWQSGDLDAALSRTAEALSMGAASAERWGEAEVRRMQGELLAAGVGKSGDAAAAAGPAARGRGDPGHRLRKLSRRRRFSRPGRRPPAAGHRARAVARCPGGRPGLNIARVTDRTGGIVAPSTKVFAV